MKAKRYKNENDLYCVSIDFESNVPDQNIIEANYKIVADLMWNVIDSFREDYNKLEMSIGNLGSLYLSDLVSQVFHCIFEICKALKPRDFYMYLFATLHTEGEICSFDTTIPNSPNDKHYMQQMGLLIFDLFSVNFLKDKFDDKSLQKAKTKAHKLNEIFDSMHPSETIMKS